ncbi:short chain type dehydrogenase [Aspergillus ustus]|uniref:Short chain type dehydrogenase n=1 Tax=Aspergillus ustus TaxID=40382 RepID=A0A0C1E1H2_ASPUT|nr:short chain type dehydrogenase [Aspergillus ustus]
MANQTEPQFATYPDLKDKIVFSHASSASGTGIGQSGDPVLTIWGNGAAIARFMAYQGAKVFGCDTDVTRDADVKRAVDECIAKYGRVDVLAKLITVVTHVHSNVGRSEPGDTATMSEQTWDAQIDINLKSAYLTCHHILPLMSSQPRGGSVVNISSIAGLRYIGKPQVAYSATKAGVIQLTKATAVIYADKGVRLNVVVPGLMHTPLVTVLAEKYAGGDLEGFVGRRNQAVPLGRMAGGKDVAMAVGFLASSQSRYITGQKIVVDGGITSATR